MNESTHQQLNNPTSWTTIIRPRSGWFDIHLGELWRYRDLIFLFVKRDFTAVYKQTVLGPLWFIVQPLFSMLVFTVIFGKVTCSGSPLFPETQTACRGSY